MPKKSKKLRPKNGIAKALRTPRYKMRVVQDKRRRELLEKLNNEIENFLKGFG